MENERPFAIGQNPMVQSTPEVATSTPQTSGAVDVRPNTPQPAAPKPLKLRSNSKPWRWIALAIAIAAAIVGGIIVVLNTTKSGNVLPLQTGEFNTVQLPLGDLTALNLSSGTKTLKVNGQLNLSGSIVFTPTSQPVNPILGQLYFDKSTNQLAYYNGQQFVSLGANQPGAGATNITNNNLFTSGSAVQLQATSPGVQQTGNFNISGVGQVGSLRTGTIENTGNITLATAGSSGVSGNISIKTGDSSTTASGNLILDTGSGVISGEVIENKTFESGVENMEPWFNTTIAQSSAQARTGTHSLAETGTAANWGVIEILPGTNVTAGHQYYFSVWVRAATTPRAIIGTMAWVGASGTVSLTPITDSTTGWTEMTGLATAPAGATSVYFRVQGTGAVGEVHYFDDMTITDLSSSSAISAINIGSTNAKVVTIGNINQIGTTSIFGGSGITLNSGAGGITMNGGVVSITGNAASTLNTTSGALILTSAAEATWGVGTASSGVGGNLTLRAGGGGADGNNNGGDLILQGGNRTGTGTSGSVIVKPQTDVADAFQIQNSAGIGLLTVDTSALKLTISGTTATFASLVLDNAHFGSTQATAPTIGTPSNCGTTPTAAVTAGSTDSAGSFTITSGTGGTSSTCDTVITFNKTYSAAPKSILVVGKTDGASAIRQPYVSASTATSFTVSFGTSAGGANSTPYNFSYWVIE